MTSNRGPAHIVVDGSNIATEGRSTPSLTQLNEAVTSFMEEFPDTAVTVVVDATFGHRIPKSESSEFDAGVANNELVAPPAGAVGRGDAFVLGIADKAGAAVLSNDSFQEFHGDYPWLFDEGRLIGGKPVPHVGWVWVNRVPVRGPVSRKATRGASSGSRPGTSSGEGSRRSSAGRRRGKASKEASAPMPVPTSPPPSAATPKPADVEPTRRPAPKRGEPVNDLMPFLEFVEQHPVGTAISAVVDAYSSHGAYLTVSPSDDDGDAPQVRVYVPLRFMADPPPRSAKRTMKIGDRIDLVVVSFSPARRSVDCAVPALADSIIAEQREDEARDEAGDASAGASDGEPDDDRPRRRSKKAAKRSDAEQPAAKTTPVKKVAAKKTAAKKTASKRAASKTTTSKKTASKKTTSKTTASKRAASKGSAAQHVPGEQPATGDRATDEPAAKKAAAKKAVAKRATKKAAAKRATEKAAAKRAETKTVAAKKTAAKKKATANAATRKRAAAKKTAAKKTATAKRANAKRTRDRAKDS